MKKCFSLILLISVFMFLNAKNEQSKSLTFEHTENCHNVKMTWITLNTTE